MSYQNIVNFGTDKHSNPHAVGSAQMTQTVANQQTNLTTSLNPNDKGISSSNTMTGTMQPASNTRATMITNYPTTTINSLNSFYNQPVANFQSHMRYNAQANANMANMTRAPNYNASIRMPGQYGGNMLMPHGTKRKQRDPNRPKRPTTAYFYFAQLEREEAAKRGERISKVSEWTKRVAEKWRNLSEEERTQFRASAAEDKTRFDQEMAVYTGKDANKPKRPQSSYFLWLADFRVRMKDKISEHKEILRAAGEEWRKLTLEDKAPYEQLAEEERKKYECRMKEYQETTKRAKIDTSSFATGTGSSTSQPITDKVGGRDNVIHHEVDDDSSNEDDDDDDADFSENEE